MNNFLAFMRALQIFKPLLAALMAVALVGTLRPVAVQGDSFLVVILW
jgi:hypothetical protein